MTYNIPVDYVIFKLNTIFNVKDISSVLETAENINEAKKVCSERDFDRVPIKKDGNIDSFYDSNKNSEIQITPEYTLSESTGIFETLTYLSKRDFYFILSGNVISRMVHYSDLNNPLVSIGIYTQIAYCETAIRNFARSKNPNKLDFGEKFLNGLNNSCGVKINVVEAKRKFEEKKSLHIETDLFDELYFNEELILFREIVKSNLDASKIAEFRDFIDLEGPRIETLKEMRNEVMHSKPKIVKEHSNINEWLMFLQNCQNIISFIGGKTMYQK